MGFRDIIIFIRSKFKGLYSFLSSAKSKGAKTEKKLEPAHRTTRFTSNETDDDEELDFLLYVKNPD